MKKLAVMFVLLMLLAGCVASADAETPEQSGGTRPENTAVSLSDPEKFPPLDSGTPEKTSGCTLEVTTSSWSGWEEGYQPKETVYTYEVDAPGFIMVPPEDGFEIEILEIDVNGITFKTETPMAPYGRGINLSTDQTVFTVYRGQTLSLVTPTMDYGDIYIITLTDIYGIQ